MMTVIYKNKATGESKEVGGVKGLDQAWRLVVPLSNTWGWNWADVVVLRK